MLRTIVVGVVGIGIGYGVGLLNGFRTAVKDYVENDARTIQRVARTMYETGNQGDELPEDVEELFESAGLTADTTESEDTSSDDKGFR